MTRIKKNTFIWVNNLPFFFNFIRCDNFFLQNLKRCRQQEYELQLEFALVIFNTHNKNQLFDWNQN